MPELKPAEPPKDNPQRGLGWLELLFGGSGGTLLQVMVEAHEHHQEVAPVQVSLLHHHSMWHLYALVLAIAIWIAYRYGKRACS